MKTPAQDELDAMQSEAAKNTKDRKPDFNLAEFLEGMVASTPDHLAEMRKLSQEAVFILPRLAMSGQLTIINASYNAGKTLLCCWLLSQRDQQATTSQRVFYINADDTFDGGIEKGEIMRDYGIQFLIPGQRGFSVEMFKQLLERAIDSRSAGEVVFVLDTLKKFVDMMDKKAARSLNDLLRRFIQAGGTVIALAHTNKNRASDGSSIAEGVGDFMNDFDCGYVIEVVSSPDATTKTVVFRNDKSRGPNLKKATFTYDNGEAKTWKDRFDSVTSLDGEEAKRTISKIEADRRHYDDIEVIRYICKRLSAGPLSRKEISQEDLTNEFSRSRREKVLERYSTDNGGENRVYWEARKGKTGGFIYHQKAIPPI